MVIATVGGELVVTLSVTGEDVVVAPRLSEATAVSVREPTIELTERSSGLDDTLLREVAPSKTWTLVTLPNEASFWVTPRGGGVILLSMRPLESTTLGNRSVEEIGFVIFAVRATNASERPYGCAKKPNVSCAMPTR
jgi:hypothetical protein